MKKLITWIMSLLTFALVSSAVAAPPHGKGTILHCGCALQDVDGTQVPVMAFIEANVSTKAKGHSKHGTIDSCFDGVDTFIDFQRNAADCYKDEEGSLPVAGLAACTTQEANTECGAPLE